MEILDWFLKALGVGVGFAVGFVIIVELHMRCQRKSLENRIDKLLKLKEELYGNDK